MRTRIAQWLERREARCAVGILAAFAILFGYLFIRTFLSAPTPHFDLDFGAARWIEPAEPAPIVYFRKDIYLPATVDQAWMQVGATDSFELYVNGSIVASNEFDATNTSGIFDLKTLLHPGHNAVGVLVTRTIYPGPARLIARLSTRSLGNPTRDLFTDATWYGEPNTALVPSGLHWSAVDVDARRWRQTKLATDFDPHVNQVDLDPRALVTAPQGQWLTSFEATAREQRFLARFTLPESGREAWLQIAAPGDYELIVNGKLCALQALDTPASVATPFFRIGQSGVVQGAPVPASTPPPGNAAPAASPAAGNAPPAANAASLPKSDPLDGGLAVVADVPAPTADLPLQLYYVTPWLRQGENEIVVRIRSSQGPVAMLADGFTVEADGSARRFTGAGTWLAVTRWAGRQAIETRPAVPAGSYGQPPWGILRQALAPTLTVPLYDSEAIARWIVAYAAILAALLGSSLLVSYLVARVRRVSFGETFLRDAFLHAPAFCAALLLWLVSYDYRLPANFAFQGKFIGALLLVLLVARFFHFLPPHRFVPVRLGWGRLVKLLLLAAIVGGGCYLRVRGLTDMSLDHDEMTLIRKAHGVLERGVPYSMIGSRARYLTTYELVSYTLAAIGALFGWGELAMRMPSCLFSTLNIVLLAWVGRRMFDWRVGWATALIYALMPVEIRWAQNAFYPAQAQFFSILTFWCFYEAISTRPFHPGYLRAAAFAFCGAYFSWEGMGFILPVLFVCLLTVRWGEYWWLKDWLFYRCLFWMSFVVIFQLCIRFLVNDAYLMVGIGLSTISTPSLFFLDSNFNPYYYLIKLPLSENHVILSVTVCACLALFWRRPAVRYLFVVVAGLMACYTNFLPVYAPRYCLFYQPLLLLLGAATVFLLWDYLCACAARAGGFYLLRLSHACMAVFAVLVFLSTNTWLLKAYRLCVEAEVPGLNIRMGSYRVDYRGASEFVKANMQPGDAVIAGIPHVYEYYSGNKGGYFLNSLLVQQTAYETMQGSSFYRDKFVGNPVIRNLPELQAVVENAPRTWVVQAPLQFAQLNQANVLNYFSKYGRVVFESYNARVILIQGVHAGE